MDLSVSKYCRVMVFWSMPLAVSKIFSRARAKPSARSCWAWRSPSAAENCGLFLAFGPQDGRLLLAVGHVDGGFARTGGFGHHRAADALGRHLAVHRLLHFARRDDLADLHVGHLDAPALGDFVQAGAQHGVDVLAFGEHIIQRDTADDRAQRGGGDTAAASSKLPTCRTDSAGSSTL